MMEMYDIAEYSTLDKFYSIKTTGRGKYKKDGIPDSVKLLGI